jgi:hypothetical protein
MSAPTPVKDYLGRIFGTLSLPASILFAGLTAIHYVRFIGWNLDDSYIVFRVIRNLLAGNGWTYNPGEHQNVVTSVTSPLAIVGVAALVGDIPLAAHLLAALWIFLTGALTFQLFRARFGDLAGIAAGVLIIDNMGSNLTWGLESHLFFFLLVLFVWLEERHRNSWPVIALLILTRPDAVVLLGYQVMKRLGTIVWLRVRRKAASQPDDTDKRISDSANELYDLGKGLMWVGAILLPWVVFSMWRFDSIFPHTLQNKMWQGRSGFWGTGWVYAKYLREHLWITSSWDRYGLTAAVVNWWTAQDWWTKYLGISTEWYRYGMLTAVVGVFFVIRDRSAWLGPVILVVLQQVAYIILNVPGYHWYFSTFDGLLFILGIYGVCGLLSSYRATARWLSLQPSRGTATDIASFALLSLLLAGGMGYGVYDAATHPARDDRDECYREVIRQIDEGPYPDGALASLEVGALGYFTNRPMVDLLGLTSMNPEYITAEHRDEFFAKPPPLILMRDPPGTFLQALANDSRFKAIYGEGKSLTARVMTGVYAFRLHSQVLTKPTLP